MCVCVIYSSIFVSGICEPQYKNNKKVKKVHFVHNLYV